MLPTTSQNLEIIKEECRTMVTKRAIVSGAAALVPLPAADIAADIAMLMELLPAISNKFGLTKEQIDEYDYQLKMLIFKLIRRTGAEVVGRVVTKEMIIVIIKRIGMRVSAKQIAKYIPIIGQTCAASISATSMKIVGNSHVEDCYKIAKQVVVAKAYPSFT